MKRGSEIRFVVWFVFVLACVLSVATTAYAQGGAVIHRYAPPPLDAGSALPNPDYLRSASGTGFDWGDAGIGAAAAFGVVLLAGGSVVVLRGRGRLAAA